MLSKSLIRGTGSLFKRTLLPSASSFSSIWKDVPQGPPDAILGVAQAYKKDTDSRKVNLSIGAYRDQNGEPWILPSVRIAQQEIIAENQDQEYLTILGSPTMAQLGAQVLFGKEFEGIKSKRIAGSQTLSGTGSLRVALEFLKLWYPNQNTKVWLPQPTWPAHHEIAKKAHYQSDTYGYYDPEKKSVNEEWMIRDINNLPDQQIVVLHACAHNPTGADPSKEAWNKLLDVFKKKKHLAMFDSAYQGFSSGSLQNDAYSIRLFAEHGIDLLVCQSFAKNLGLYGQRAGTLQILTQSPEEKERVSSQLKRIARPLYSSPPKFGARVVQKVLGTPKLQKMWHQQLVVMSSRIHKMRQALKSQLQTVGSQHDWSHITNQIGMFAYTGLSKEAVEQLVNKYHIYLPASGRISVAGLNEKNVSYVANAFHEVSKNSKI